MKKYKVTMSKYIEYDVYGNSSFNLGIFDTIDEAIEVGRKAITKEMKDYSESDSLEQEVWDDRSTEEKYSEEYFIDGGMHALFEVMPSLVIKPDESVSGREIVEAMQKGVRIAVQKADGTFVSL